MHRKSIKKHAVDKQPIDPFLEDITKFLSSRAFATHAREATVPGGEENVNFSSLHEFILDSSAAYPV